MLKINFSTLAIFGFLKNFRGATPPDPLRLYATLHSTGPKIIPPLKNSGYASESTTVFFTCLKKVNRQRTYHCFDFLISHRLFTANFLMKNFNLIGDGRWLVLKIRYRKQNHKNQISTSFTARQENHWDTAKIAASPDFRNTSHLR